MGSHNVEQELTTDISPTMMEDKKNEKYKADKWNEIEARVCALLNSGGGKLKLKSDDNTDFNGSHMKMIEQCLSNVVSITIMKKNMKIDRNQQEITIDVKGANELSTVKYNLYLPTKSQVVVVEATTPTQDIRKILQKKIVQVFVSPGSHVKRFVKGESSGLQESEDVQLKNLKADQSKCVQLADRMVGKNNKFMSYVSAFANHHGGHIYYGITDDGGIAEGEKVTTEKEKDDITKKITKTIDKMIWTLDHSKPRRGEHWDIFFENVKDTAGNQLPSVYVIVVYIAACPGGVFVEEPESYHVVKGQVKKMGFQDWQSNLFGLSLPSNMRRVTWSSQKNRNIFRKFSEKLTEQRNNESMKQFKKLCTRIRTSNLGINVELIILAEEIVAAYKIFDFTQAKSLLENFAKILPSSKDHLIFEVRMLQLKSMIERSDGNYRDSYSLTHQGLQIMDQTPLELQTAWFYIDGSVDSTYISMNESCIENILSNKENALKYIELAAKAAERLKTSLPSSPDLLQKIHIHKVWALLGCGMNGEVVEQFKPSRKDLQAATEELTYIQKSSLNNGITHFRKVQHHLAECDLNRRRFDVLGEDSNQSLEQAMECASKARDLAEKHKSDMMVKYSTRRLKDINRKRDTVNSHTDRTFLGFEY